MTEIEQIFSIERHNDYLRIVIQNREHSLTIIWSVACIIIFIPLALIVLTALSAIPGWYSLALLAVLFVTGWAIVDSLHVLRWQNKGIETVVVDSDHLKIARSIGTDTREKMLRLSTITGLTVDRAEHNIGGKWTYLRPTTISSFHIGRISVQSDKSIYRFGSGLTTTEATSIVNAIRAFRRGE